MTVCKKAFVLIMDAFCYSVRKERKNMREKPQATDSGSNSRNNAHDAHVAEQIIRYMVDYFDEIVSLQCVAAHFGYEVCYFSKLFKKLLGVSYMQFRNRIRVEIAIVFLRYTDKAVTEVAGCCGFSTIRNFNRVFHDVTGATPSEVRLMPDKVYTKTIKIPAEQMYVREIVQKKFAILTKQE